MANMPPFNRDFFFTPEHKMAKPVVVYDIRKDRFYIETPFFYALFLVHWLKVVPPFVSA